MTNAENSLLKMSNADADIAALNKEWDDARCPICMDHPHNAVLLLCSSYDKGCRPYLCDTSYRHSNCLDRFRKIKVNRDNSSQASSSMPSSSLLGDMGNQNVGERHPYGLTIGSPTVGLNLSEPYGEFNPRGNGDHSSSGLSGAQEETNTNQDLNLTVEAQEGEMSGQGESSEMSNSNALMCPLCRGTVKGWKIIKEARQYLDEKSRACSRESCTFSGNYRELRRHARRVHPTTRPADVDPSRRRAWHRLEHQREYGDILSAIRSAMPGAIVLGDYVIDGGDVFSHERDGGGPSEGSGSLLTTFFLFHMISSPMRSVDEPRGSSRGLRRQRRRYLWGENLLGLQDDDDEEEVEDLDEDIQRPRRRRRFVRSRSEERP